MNILWLECTSLQLEHVNMQGHLALLAYTTAYPMVGYLVKKI
eukprot:CAMPEP_0178715992 /NCGR_PEP_ID=MMETSP0699-20121125/21014_1 /TAXON_ID=265572 /ORGANISM="Extubocellulus spinifer, Strain CCMP396" /LENGTH=41 /DNA_ID= /DNA_START= /DNA_END= /DNA_ORIENTATION=